MSAASVTERDRHWKWLVCGLLLLATMINYMDRLTLNLLATQLIDYFHLTKAQYGRIEAAFAVAFAVGALFMGWLADRINVRWLYAAAVLVWSAAGFLTGFAGGFVSLLWCRFLLGLAEAGNWPSPRTTQRILTPAERTMGNSILQSGASIGSILTPLILIGLGYWTGSWRPPFLVIGGIGTLWVVLWLRVVRPADLALPPRPNAAGAVEDFKLAHALQIRRFAALVVVVVTINGTWHFFRVWLPLFLQKQHDYSPDQTKLFFAAYYGRPILGAVGGFCELWLRARLVRSRQSPVRLPRRCRSDFAERGGRRAAHRAAAADAAADYRFRVAGRVPLLLLADPGFDHAAPGQAHWCARFQLLDFDGRVARGGRRLRREDEFLRSWRTAGGTGSAGRLRGAAATLGQDRGVLM